MDPNESLQDILKQMTIIRNFQVQTLDLSDRMIIHIKNLMLQCPCVPPRRPTPRPLPRQYVNRNEDLTVNHKDEEKTLVIKKKTKKRAKISPKRK